MRGSNSGWMVASIEACVIVALAVLAFAPASQEPRGHARPPETGSPPGPPPSTEPRSATDLDAVREVVRSELAAHDARRGTRPSPPAPPRDVALDHLRKNRFHHQLDDYLRTGEIAQQDLDALQEQSMLLAERDQDAALSRLARAINTEQLRVRP